MDEVERERSKRRAQEAEDREKKRENEERGVARERSEEQHSGERDNGKKKEKQKGRRWADVSQFAFSEALTKIVEELQKLQRCTKDIVGESEWEGRGMKTL